MSYYCLSLPRHAAVVVTKTMLFLPTNRLFADTFAALSPLLMITPVYHAPTASVVNWRHLRLKTFTTAFPADAIAAPQHEREQEVPRARAPYARIPAHASQHCCLSCACCTAHMDERCHHAVEAFYRRGSRLMLERRAYSAALRQYLISLHDIVEAAVPATRFYTRAKEFLLRRKMPLSARRCPRHYCSRPKRTRLFTLLPPPTCFRGRLPAEPLESTFRQRAPVTPGVSLPSAMFFLIYFMPVGARARLSRHACP